MPAESAPYLTFVGLARMSDQMLMEGIYYSHVIPRNLSVLTLMGLVFDKVHFPGAYLPATGFDRKELQKEIARLEELPRDHDTASLISIFKFLEFVPTLEGFCEFQPNTTEFFNDRRFPDQVIKQMFDTLYGPLPEGWQPMISAAHNKGLPGGDESIAYRGEFHQLANAIVESAGSGIPLINDVPGLPVFSDVSTPVGDAQALAGLLSMLCMQMVLPEVPVLSPPDLMGFRQETKKELRAYRRSMLSFAADLNKALNQNADEREIERAAQFFVKTHVTPQLDELRETLGKKNFGWIARSAYKMLPTVGAGYLTGGTMGGIATLLTGGAALIPNEYSSAHSAIKAAKKSGLYYLLKAEKIGNK